MKLVSRGKVDEGLWKMIIANVRAKKEVAGDLRAQIAANEMGIRRLTVLAEKYGVDTIIFYMDRLLEYTEQRVRTELRKLPRVRLKRKVIWMTTELRPSQYSLKRASR